MNVTMISWTPNPETVVAAAGKTCYSDMPTEEILDMITEDETKSFIKTLMASGHLSPLEHVSFTFAITEVSRSLLAQLTRHRIASFSVQSQRYVNMKDARYAIPDDILENPHALRVMEDFMDQESRAYHDIHAYLMSQELKEKYGDQIQHAGLNLAFQNNPKYFHLALQS